MSPRPFALGWSVLAATAFAIGCGDEAAGQEITGEIERFELFTECAPVKLFSPALSASGSNYPGTSFSLPPDYVRDYEMTAESRFRSARIWGGKTGSFEPLTFSFVLPLMFGPERAYFYKELRDPLSGELSTRQVWSDGLGLRISLGDEARPPSAMRASMLVDHFILQYLRVNEGYC